MLEWNEGGDAVLALTKTLLLLAAVALVGAVGYRLLISPAVSPAVRLGVIIGAAVLVVASLAELLLTLQSVLGFVSADLFWEYLLGSRHGGAVLIRIALVIPVVILALHPSRVARYLALPCGLGLLATFSAISHAYAMGGLIPMAMDLIHFAAASCWLAAIGYTAFGPFWQGQDEAVRTRRFALMRGVSRVSLISVLVLAVTGVYAANLHLALPEGLSDTAYGQALLGKNSLILVTLAVAAVNRFALLPHAHQPQAAARLSWTMKLETLLLMAVLAATGILTTSPLPHD